jgi:hypothetical protein
MLLPMLIAGLALDTHKATELCIPRGQGRLASPVHFHMSITRDKEGE